MAGMQIISVHGRTVRPVRAVCFVELVWLKGKIYFDIALQSTCEKVFTNQNETCQLPVRTRLVKLISCAKTWIRKESTAVLSVYRKGSGINIVLQGLELVQAKRMQDGT
jgi:hypothetical protein